MIYPKKEKAVVTPITTTFMDMLQKPTEAYPLYHLFSGKSRHLKIIVFNCIQKPFKFDFTASGI